MQQLQVNTVSFHIVFFVLLALAALASVQAEEPPKSSYYNDPFITPGIITPLTLPDSWPTNIHRNPHNLSSNTANTKLVILGTGTPLPNPYRSGAGYALIVNDTPYIIDAGEGIWRSISRAALVNGDEFTRGLSPKKIKHVFITHLHIDHTVGIPSLLLNSFKLNIPAAKEIYGPKGIKAMVQNLLAAWTIDIEDTIGVGYNPEGARATGHEISVKESGIVFQDENVKVEAFRSKHGTLQHTFAYRFTTKDRVVVFTGDGGAYHSNIVKAAMNADVLVTEAVTEKNIKYAPWGGETIEQKKKTIFNYHFSPAVLARIANEAKVKTIVLSHEQNYSSGKGYDPLGLLNEIKASGFAGAIYSAMDADVY